MEVTNIEIPAPPQPKKQHVVQPLADRIAKHKEKLILMENNLKYRDLMSFLQDKNLNMTERVNAVKDFLRDEIIAEYESEKEFDADLEKDFDESIENFDKPSIVSKKI